MRAGDRATEFGQRCRQLGITGVTLHTCSAVSQDHTEAEALANLQAATDLYLESFPHRPNGT